MPYGLRDPCSRPEVVGRACPHDCEPAHAHAALRHHVLLVCTLKQRFSGVRFSDVRYSRSCAWSSMRALTRARALMQCACSLTQCARARYLRSWTRCRRSDRAPPSHGIALPCPSMGKPRTTCGPGATLVHGLSVRVPELESRELDMAVSYHGRPSTGFLPTIQPPPYYDARGSGCVRATTYFYRNSIHKVRELDRVDEALARLWHLERLPLDVAVHHAADEPVAKHDVLLAHALVRA